MAVSDCGVGKTLIAVAMIATASPPAARAQTARLNDCKQAMAALGIATVPQPGGLRSSYDSVRRKTLVVLPPEQSAVPAKSGVQAITAIMEPESRPPAPLPDAQLDLLVLSPAPRPPEERIVRFVLDGADSIVTGPGVVAPAQTHGPGTLEHITVLISARDVMRLLQAKAVRARLGSTEFPVTESLRDGMRAMALYVQCGAA